jgi:signal transduction histidine kinase
LVGELFELAKLDARETRPARERFAVDELLQDLAQKFRLPAARRGVRIETELAAGAPSVWADIGLIERVLENLIDNAIRHAGEGGAIRLAARPATGTVEVRVSDTGSGIPPGEIPRIFDRHHQAVDAHDDRSGRAGLGLAIAKRILELHGSAIEATSAPDAGTTFAFTLPVAPAVTNS